MRTGLRKQSRYDELYVTRLNHRNRRNELPDCLDELGSDKTIVTMCPHYDRAEIARLYLTLKGYHAHYLTARMLKLVDYLRGDKARDYIANL